MNDLISRQDAIDEVVAWLKDRMSDKKNGKPLTERLKDLPPAQSELIYCKDCKFTDGKGPIADGRYWCVLHESFMYFCSDAERRTDE